MPMIGKPLTDRLSPGALRTLKSAGIGIASAGVIYAGGDYLALDSLQSKIQNASHSDPIQFLETVQLAEKMYRETLSKLPGYSALFGTCSFLWDRYTGFSFSKTP